MNQKHYSQDLNKIVDSHCHLDFKDFDSDRDKIVNNAKLTNVLEIVERLLPTRFTLFG